MKAGNSIKAANRSFYVNRQDDRRKYAAHPSKHYGFPRIIEFLTHYLSAGMDVMDIGSGVGMAATRLSEQGVTPYCLDISIDSLKSCQASDHNLLYYICADAENLPLKSGSFDAAYFLGSLHHLPSPEDGIAEAHRILKHGGYLMLVEPNNIMGRKSFDGQVEQQLSLKYVLRIAGQAGFRIREVKMQRIIIKLLSYLGLNVNKFWEPLQTIDRLTFEHIPLINKCGDYMFVALQKIE
jgi:SAM-dependent methyltransferase